MVRRLKSKEGRIEEVILNLVERDDSYQRNVQRHSKFIEDEFDPAAAGTGTVGIRGDGKMYWIDGLQRATAMTKLGIMKWRCIVLESPGPQYEAHIFSLLNGREGRKSLNQTQLYKSKITEGDPIALAVRRATEAAGFKVKREGCTKGWPLIASAGLLLRVCKSYGEECLTEGLKLLASTWPQVDDACHQSIIGAVLMVQYNYGTILDKEHWLATVGKMIPKSILMNCRGSIGGSTYGPLADQMIARYNKGKRGGQRFKLFTQEGIGGIGSRISKPNKDESDEAKTV